MATVHVFGAAGFAGAQLASLPRPPPLVRARGHHRARRRRQAAGGRVAPVPGRAAPGGPRRRSGRLRRLRRGLLPARRGGRPRVRADRPRRPGARRVGRPPAARRRRSTRRSTASTTRGPTCWPRRSTACPSATATRSPSARLVANPGCFPEASILALLPLAGALADVVIDSKSGVERRGPHAHRDRPLLERRRQREPVQGLRAPAHARDRAGARRRGDVHARTWCRSTGACCPPATPGSSAATCRTRTTCSPLYSGHYADAPVRRGRRAAARHARRAAHELRAGLPGGRPARRARHRVRRDRQPGQGRGRARPCRTSTSWRGSPRRRASSEPRRPCRLAPGAGGTRRPPRVAR